MQMKVTDVTTKMVTSAIGTLKEAKEKKAEAAFYSMLDSAVNARSNDMTQSFSQTVSSNQASTKQDASVNNQSTVKDTTTQTNTKDVSKTNQTTPNSKSQKKTEFEQAKEVVEEVCKQLGITEEELYAQFDQLSAAIASLLMQELGVTQQELDLVVEELGLDLTDLFNQSDLMNTVVALTGAEDISAVLTNESLYGQVKEISAQLDALQESFPVVEELEPQDLKSLQDNLQLLQNAPVVQEQPREVLREDDSDKTLLRQNVSTETQNVETEEAVSGPTLEVVKEKSSAKEDTSSHGQSMTGQEGFSQFANRVAQNMNPTAVDGAQQFAQQAELEAVIREITDYVKLQVNAETTSMEMQLHPESYGKLNLHIAVRDGVVTARMAVENEAVRSALESQLVQLREDMNERGLKVDAVEVTIASHEFERNLEEGQEGQSGTEEDLQRRPRQINLNDEGMTLEELAEMSEAEALTRRIMLENGNSIDFSA